MEGAASEMLAESAKDGKPRLMPYLSAQEATTLLGSAQRAVGVLTYGWTTRGDPDPTGSYLRHLRTYLCSSGGAHVRGVFWGK